MPGRLYLAIDFFVPALLRPVAPPDDYSHDAAAIHVILQPMLLSSTANDVSTLDVNTYLQSWTADSLVANPPILIGEALGHRLGAGGDIVATPVPFPPCTSLLFQAEWTNADGTSGTYPAEERVIGGTTPVGQSVVALDQLPVAGTSGWPMLASLSSALPLIKDFADLDFDPATNSISLKGPQKEIVRRWLIGLFTKMKETAQAEPPPEWLNPDHGAWKNVWDQVRQQTEATPLSDIAGWDRILQTAAPGQPAPAAAIYNLLLESYAPITVDDALNKDPVIKSRPPRFTFQPKQVLGRGELFSGGQNLAGRSYLHALWNELKQQAGTETPQSMSQTLGRLFGFGERLAWPRARLDGSTPDASRRFMVLRPKHSEGTDGHPDWFITNVVSAAGQVFRLAPVGLKSPLAAAAIKQIKVQGKNLEQYPAEAMSPVQLATRGLSGIQQQAVDVPAARPIVVTPEWRAEYTSTPDNGSRRDRMVFWQTRQATTDRIQPPAIPEKRAGTDRRDSTKDDNNIAYYAVPSVLLDAVDDQARMVSDEPGRLPQRQAPRRGMLVNDLFGDTAFYNSIPRLFRLPAQLDAYRLGEGSAALLNAFVLRVGSPLNPVDAPAMAWLGASASSGPNRQIELWVAQKERKSPIRVVLSTPGKQWLVGYPQDTDGAVLVVDEKGDPGDEAGPLALALQNSEEGPARANTFHGWSVDVVFSTFSGEPFNILVDAKGQFPERLKMLELSRALVTRLSHTSDRIAHSLAVTWTPGFDPDSHSTDLQANYGADSNKLRLSIPGFIKASPPGDFSLSEPDALIPLARSGGVRPFEVSGSIQPTGPQAWYWLAHHLDQDRQTTDFYEEELRFRAWVAAGSTWTLNGYMEHQYGHQIAVRSLDTDLRRGVDIASPTDVFFRGLLMDERSAAVKQAEDAVKKATVAGSAAPPAVDVNVRRVLLRFEEPVAGTFRVSLGRKAVRLAIEKYNRVDADPSGRDAGAEGGPTGAIRQLYRAFSELRDCIAASQAGFVLEAFAFNNSIVESRPTDVDLGVSERPVAPNIVRNLTLVENAFTSIPMPSPTSALGKVFVALDGTLAQFVQSLEAAVPKTAEDKKLDIDTSWATLVEYKRPDIKDRAHFVRAGMQLLRRTEQVVDKDWGTALFVPLNDPKLFDSSGETRLRKQARAELVQYLMPPGTDPNSTPSRLWSRFGVVERKRDVDQPDGVVLGELDPMLLPPNGAFAPVDPVIDVFYVPFGFLVPRAHPALADRQGTVDFGRWLIRLLWDLAEGRPVDVPIDGVSSLTEEVRLRADALRLLSGTDKPSVVDALDRLLARVDRDGVTGGTDHETALFAHVSNLVRALDDLEDQSWSKVRRTMLARRPVLFEEAKGIGVGIFNARHPDSAPLGFNRDAFSTQLFSLSLTKKIIRDQDPPNLPENRKVSEFERFDYTRFHGTTRNAAMRYFVDVLPETVYDDTLEITQNTYKNIAKTDFSVLGEPRKRADLVINGTTPRGGASARSAENVIDRPQISPAIGDIEANVVHYNPEWRVKGRNVAGKDDAQFFYFLPETTLPPVPRMVAKVLKPDSNPQAPPTQSPALRSPIAVRNPAQKPDLTAQWRTEADKIVSDLGVVLLPQEGGGFRTFKRVSDSHGSALPRLRADYCKGWHLLTTHLSHHWFEIDLQRPAESLKANLDDDAYEVEIELWNGRPFPEAVPAGPAAHEPSRLLAWYDALRKRARGEQAAAPPKVPVQALMLELKAWLTEKSGAFGNQTLLEPPAADVSIADPHDGREAYRKFRITPPPPVAGGKWKITLVGDPDAPMEMGDLGSWAAFEIYAPADPAGNVLDYSTAPPADQFGRQHTFLLRLSILDHPFHISRARTRVVRNWKQLGDEVGGDLRPEFVLTERFSAWTSYGRDRTRIDVAFLQAADRDIMEEQGGAVFVQPASSRRDWLTRWREGGAGIGAEVAKALGDSLEASFVAKDGSTAYLWEKDYMKGLRHTVGATLSQPFYDLMPQYGVEGLVARNLDDPRHHSSGGFVFGAASWDDFCKSFELMDSRSVGLEPLFEFTWYDDNKIAVLTIQLPLFVKA